MSLENGIGGDVAAVASGGTLEGVSLAGVAAPGEAGRQAELLKECKVEGALWNWVKQHLGLHVPRRAFCKGHAAPFDYLKASYFEPGRDLVVWGPRGGGKTRLAAAATLLDLLHKPGIQVRVLGGSLEQSLRVWEHLVPDLEELAPDELMGGRTRARRVRLRSGSSAAVLAQSERAVRGQRVQKMRCDEVEMFDPEVWSAVGATTRSMLAPASRAGVFAGTVEALSTHHKAHGPMSKVIARAEARGTPVLKWCVLDVMARCEDWRECGTCALNKECGGRAKQVGPDGVPLADGFVPVEDVLRIKGRLSTEKWESEMLCLRPSREGRVFPSFSPDTHVREFPEPPFPLSLGVDFGYRAPFVALWIGRDESGAVHVVDEYVMREKTVAEHARHLLGHPRHARQVYCDPAGRARNEQTGEGSDRVMRRAGFTVSSRRSQIQEGVEQIRLLCRSATGESRLVVHPRCAGLIKALEGYHYTEAGQSELPEKDGEHDHLIDALRYWVIANVGVEPTTSRPT